MKKFLFVISLALLTSVAYSQNVNDDLNRLVRMLSDILADTIPQEVAVVVSDIRVETKKKRGYFNSTQIGMLRGNTQIVELTPFYIPLPNYPFQVISERYETRSEMQISPSFTITNGYMFNEHLAAGVGIGFEIFERNFFPVFADFRYTLWDSKVSPFFAVKAGYSFGDFKKKHYERPLPLPYEPYYVYNADFRNYGGLMVHPEMGVKVSISNNADLLFSIAYRYQEIKTTITKRQNFGPHNVNNPYYDEWDHKESLNRLYFGIAIMFK